MSIKKKFNPIIIAFVLSFIWWFYLASTSQMIVVHDAEGLKLFALSIRELGAGAYFAGSPGSEPLYPSIIALSMVLGDVLSANAESVQILLQLIILGISQQLVYLTCKKFQVRNAIIFFVVLYMGFSPAFLNSALSAFSEIATYPFIIGIVLVNSAVLKALNRNGKKDIFLLGSFLGTLFVCMVFVKAAYEFIFYAFLIPYICIFLLSVLKKKKKTSLSLGIFLLSVVFAFHCLVIPYKWMKKNSGKDFAIAGSKGAYVLYNSAAIRAEKISPKRIFSLLVYTLGPGYCNAVFGLEECTFWNTGNLEGFMAKKEIQEKLRKAPVEKRNQVLSLAAKKKILEHPFQFTLLMGVDALRLFFWESTRIGFVVYPQGLTKIYENQIFKLLIRLVLGLGSLSATLYSAFVVFRKRNKLFALSEDDGLFVTATFFVLLIIFSHVGLYAFVAAAVARHALPLAPLHLILIAVCINRISGPWSICKRQENNLDSNE